MTYAFLFSNTIITATARTISPPIRRRITNRYHSSNRIMVRGTRITRNNRSVSRLAPTRMHRKQTREDAAHNIIDSCIINSALCEHSDAATTPHPVHPGCLVADKSQFFSFLSSDFSVFVKLKFSFL